MADPAQHYRDDLNEAASYLTKQIPEIADWIRDKLDQHPVMQSIQPHQQLRPPPNQQKPPGYNAGVQHSRTTSGSSNGTSETNITTDSGIGMGRRAPVSPPNIARNRNDYVRPNNFQLGPRPSQPNNYDEFERPSIDPRSRQPYRPRIAPNAPPIDGMPKETPNQPGTPTGNVKDKTRMWEQMGLLKIVQQ